MKNQQLDGVTLVRWAGKRSDDPLIKFLTFTVLGLILCLPLLIFVPWFRNFGTAALFVCAFATILTIPVLAAQRSVMRGVTKRINEALTELVADYGDIISVREVRCLMKSGKHRSLSMVGASGLGLTIKRMPSVAEDAPDNWRAVVVARPLKTGTASFDRLLAAVLEA